MTAPVTEADLAELEVDVYALDHGQLARWVLRLVGEVRAGRAELAKAARREQWVVDTARPERDRLKKALEAVLDHPGLGYAALCSGNCRPGGNQHEAGCRWMQAVTALNGAA